MQVPNTRDWKIVAKEIVRFVSAEALFDDARPVRYSLLYDPHPMALPSSIGPYGKPGGPKLLKLREVILTSYHHNEVRGCASCYYRQMESEKSGHEDRQVWQYVEALFLCDVSIGARGCLFVT
jgi:hypothetical protein